MNFLHWTAQDMQQDNLTEEEPEDQLGVLPAPSLASDNGQYQLLQKKVQETLEFAVTE